MKARASIGLAAFLLATSLVGAAQVWQSTFDTGTDGVVDVQNANPNKVMIGPNTGGRLTIVTSARGVAQADKAGRPVGKTLTANDSMGALFKFNYSQLGVAPTPGVGVD